MNLKEFLQTWNGVLDENRFNRKVIVVLGIGVVILAMMLVNKTERIILQPVTLTENAWLEIDDASTSYRESWGAYLAMLLGNVTPENLEFIKGRLSPLLSPSIYNEVRTALERQAMEIRENRATFKFELRSVRYELSSKKVFANGISYESGAGGEERRQEKTFEFIIKVRDYLPEITYVTTYSGTPRTQRVLDRMKVKDDRQSAASQ